MVVWARQAGTRNKQGPASKHSHRFANRFFAKGLLAQESTAKGLGCIQFSALLGRRCSTLYQRTVRMFARDPPISRGAKHLITQYLQESRTPSRTIVDTLRPVAAWLGKSFADFFQRSFDNRRRRWGVLRASINGQFRDSFAILSRIRRPIVHSGCEVPLNYLAAAHKAGVSALYLKLVPSSGQFVADVL